MCNKCEEGLVEWDGQCVKCEEGGGGLLFLFLLVVFALVVFVHILSSRDQMARSAHLRVFMYVDA